MFKQTIQIKIPADTASMIRNCQDKVGLGRTIAGAVDRQNELSVNRIQQQISGPLLRVRTGHLRESIQQTDAIVGDGVVRSSVGSNVRSGGASLAYAAPLEFGSRPHLIRPKNGKALRFIMGGKLIFAKEVHHPGNKAYSYIRGTVSDRLPAYTNDICGSAFKFLTGGNN